MNAPTFQILLERRIRLIQAILGAKAEEYSSADDRLHNFKIGAKFWETTPELYCLQLCTKHLVSIRDMVMSGKDYPMATWDEKIGDAINYLILLEGLVQERLNESVDRELQNVPAFFVPAKRF